MDVDEQPCPSPYPPASSSSSSSLLKDISNFKTPQRPSQNPNFHSPCPQFFTASKQTPRPPSSFRRRPSLGPSSSAAARRLKAFELEQSKSARKAQIKKERSLKSLSKSLTVWLNFLFQNPQSCGCDPLIGGDLGKNVGTASKGKRDGEPGVSVGVDGRWRSPKRQRDSSWRASESENEENGLDFSNSMFSYLKSSLKDVCSLDDLKERMTVYLSLRSCKEIFTMMTQVAKNIDDGRLTMKPHCPIVTDVGMKEKATRILMCYNPIWLRIGLYIILGGDSLLANGDAHSDLEITFLKMIIEKQFFSHSGLAKSYAYNKKVEGLYRPGYYESLGNIILKRILLLVLILDRAKSHSSLPLKYGIDGLDGGSPLLFMVHSGIKSSRQVINDFLSSDVMHGEGNLLAHLVIVGYKVSYQQCPLIEYDFRVTDLFVDLQDGVWLCRAIHLLQHDSSILMKLVVPSDTRKKNTVNCGIALQYLRQADVALHDEDGMMIVGDDVVNGDKELILSLLWNMFSQMQLPLLINKTLLVEEICKIREVQDFSHSIGSTPLEILFNWIQAICEHYDFRIKDFSSLVDGKAIWCLLDHYFRKELHCSHSFKDPCETKGEESVVSAIYYSDAVHNFILSQKLTTLLGNFPEVLQISDILEHNGASNDRSVVILLVFLASQLIIKRNMDRLNFHKLFGCTCPSLERKHFDIGHCCAPSEAVQNQEVIDGHINEDTVRKFKAIQAWWRDMAEQNYGCVLKPATSTSRCFSTSKHNINIQRDNAAKIIQSHFRGLIERRKFLKMTNAVSFLQTVMRAWLAVRQKLAVNKYCTIKFEEFSRERSKLSETFRRYAMLIVDRHGFVKLKRSVLLIQRAARNWIARKNQGRRSISLNRLNPDLVSAAIVVQKCIRGWTARSRYITWVVPSEKGSLRSQVKSENDVQIKAAVKIQHAWKNFIIWNSLRFQHFAATKIQSHLRCWLLRRRFLIQKQAVTKIQSYLRCLRCYRAFQQYKIATRSATIIQSYVRGWIEQERASIHRNLIVVIQRHCRGWMVRRDFLYKREAAIKIQSAIRCLNYSKAFHRHRHAALDIQRFVKGQMTRNRILGNSSFRAAVPRHCIFRTSVDCFWSFELKIVLFSVLRLQRWWKGVLLHRLKTKSAVIIQAHIRGWIIKRKAARERHRIVVIQSYWKGYLARKESREQLHDLRLRVGKSAANVDDGMRIINRLLVALSELLSMKSVSGILHICATLDMATAHSQKCCEELVAAGAISTLLKLICSVSRSIPDQEVLKHALSTLRNLVRYPHLVQILIDSRGSVETILWELLRSKEEGYFIASELLQKICSEHRGAESVRNSPALLKRLHSMVEELARKANFEKRNARGLVARETNTERRLREAVELLKLTLNG